MPRKRQRKELNRECLSPVLSLTGECLMKKARDNEEQREGISSIII
jgi:hypothetical protein